MTEKTPATTSVIRWKAAVCDAANCMRANDTPEQSVAGHTSQASFQFASLHEYKGGHQPEGDEDGDEGELPAGHGGKGELIEAAHCGKRHDRGADGAERHRGRVGDQVEHGSVEGREAEAHHHRAGDSHRRPEAGGALDDRPEGEGNQQHLQAPVERDVDDRFLDDLELAGDDRHGVEEHGSEDDPDDAQKARERPIGKGRECRLEGHAEGQAGDEKSGQNAVEGGIGRADAEMAHAPLIAMRMEGDEIQEGHDRDCRYDRGKSDIAQRIVILMVHLRYHRRRKAGVQQE